MAPGLTTDPVRSIPTPSTQPAPPTAQPPVTQPANPPATNPLATLPAAAIPQATQQTTPQPLPQPPPQTPQEIAIQRYKSDNQRYYRAVVQELHQSLNGGVWGFFPEQDKALALIKTLSPEDIAEVKRIYNDRFTRKDGTQMRDFDIDLQNALSPENLAIAQKHISDKAPAQAAPAQAPEKATLDKRADVIHETLRPWLGKPKVEPIYDALSGLSLTEKKALEELYKSKYKIELSQDLQNDKLSDASRGRINAMLDLSDREKSVTGLTKAQALHYAMHENSEPDQAAIVGILSTVHPAKIEQLKREYDAYSGPVVLNSAGKKDLLGDIQDKMSGRAQFLAQDYLTSQAGVRANSPDDLWLNARAIVERAEKHYNFERSVEATNGIVEALPGTHKDENLKDQFARLNAEYEKAIEDKRITVDEWKRINELATYVRGDTATYADAKDGVVQTAALAADTAATVAVSAALGGTPLLVRAPAAIITGSLSYQGTKQGLQGAAYDRYQANNDYVVGAIDSAAMLAGLKIAGGATNIAGKSVAQKLTSATAGGAIGGGISAGGKTAYDGGDVGEVAASTAVGAAVGAVAGAAGGSAGVGTNAAVSATYRASKQGLSYLGGRYQAAKAALGQTLASGVTKAQQGLNSLRSGAPAGTAPVTPPPVATPPAAATVGAQTPPAAPTPVAGAPTPATGNPSGGGISHSYQISQPAVAAPSVSPAPVVVYQGTGGAHPGSVPNSATAQAAEQVPITPPSPTSPIASPVPPSAAPAVSPVTQPKPTSASPQPASSQASTPADNAVLPPAPSTPTQDVARQLSYQQVIPETPRAQFNLPGLSQAQIAEARMLNGTLSPNSKVGKAFEKNWTTYLQNLSRRGVIQEQGSTLMLFGGGSTDQLANPQVITLVNPYALTTPTNVAAQLVQTLKKSDFNGGVRFVTDKNKAFFNNENIVVLAATKEEAEKGRQILVDVLQKNNIGLGDIQ